MYEKLPLDFIGVTEKFGYKSPVNGISSFHYAIDLGWHDYQGEPVYAIYDSTVVYEAYDVNLGNYIVLSYKKNNNTIIYRFLHLKNRTSLKKGDKVKRGQIVGNMGTTGDSNGYHLHFEYWICPNNYTYYYGDRSKYAVDPLKYCYLFDDQEVSSSSKNLVTKVVGTSLTKERDINKNQVEVKGINLRCRKEPGLSSQVLGYIDYGIYDILEKKEKDGYTWFKLDNNKWIANVDEDVEYYEKEEIIPDEEQTNEENELDKNYNFFKAPKKGYYYIYLEEDEVIYFPK